MSRQRRWKESDLVKSSIKRPKIVNKLIPYEDDQQMAIVEYMQHKYPKIKFTYTMGDVRLTPNQAKKAKLMGYGKGISDMIFYKACHGYHGLAIELKRSEKEKPTPEQQEWIDYFNEEGYFAYCAKGQDEAMAILDHYLN